VQRGRGGRELYKFLVGKPEGNRPMWRTRRAWEDNIKLYLYEVICGVMDWIGWLKIETGGVHL
jgi:hypothetical protein